MTTFRVAMLGMAMSLLGAEAGATDAVKPAIQVQARAVPVNIASQPLGQALNKLAEQTKLQLIFYSEIGKGIAAPAVSGTLTPRAALTRLLANTGLRYEYLDAQTVAILPDGDTSSTNSKIAELLSRMKDGELTAIRLAQASDAMDAAEAATTGNTKAPSAKGDAVQEMVVQGERDKPAPFSSSNIDLMRTKDDALPFVVFTARDIELSGAANLEEFFRDRLPQNFSAAVVGQSDSSAASGNMGMGGLSVNRDAYGEVDMRGWGVGETIILINGRRLPYRNIGANGESSRAGNYSGIPLGSIERVEILPSAGSAIYGENATGGVINIITRRDYKGGQAMVGYENPWSGSGSQRTADFNYSTPLQYGLTLRLSGAYKSSSPLLVEDRADVTTLRWRSIAMAREPQRITARTASPPLGSTPNIRTAVTTATAPGLFGNGSTYFAHVPAGYAGGGGLAAFTNTAGVYKLDLAEGTDDFIYSSKAPIGTDGEDKSFTLALEKRLGQHLELSLEYARNDTRRVYTGDYQEGPTVTVPTAAPTNPFGVDVIVRYEDPRLNLPGLGGSISRTNSDRITATLRGSFGDWRSIVDVFYVKDRGTWNTDAYSSPIGGWRNALLNGTYNPFVDMRTVSPGAPGFYDEFVHTSFNTSGSARNYQVSAKASGPLFSLPAGAIQTTAGLEWMRQDRDQAYLGALYLNSRTGLPEPAFPGDPRSWGGSVPPSVFYVFDTYSAYAETQAPIFSPKNAIPLLYKLDVFASGRTSYQSRNGFRSDGVPVPFTSIPHLYAAGVRYEMLEGMSVRISRSIGFKPPSISQVTPSDPCLTCQPVVVTDPRRNNESVSINRATQYASGGNPDILPETGYSSNIGFVLNPSWVRGMRLSVDYVETIRDDAISSLSAQEAVNLEADIPGRIVREAGAPGQPGRIVYLDVRNINFRQIVSKSMDFSLEQRFENVFGGRLSFALMATRNISFKVQTSNTTPALEQVRNPTAAFARQIEWNGNGQLQWSGQRWSFGWSTRYFDDILANPAFYLLQGADRADSALNHDVFAGYRSPRLENPRGWQHLLSGTSISFGIKNLLDREPRFWAADTTRGIVSYDAIAGRSLWLQARHEF